MLLALRSLYEPSAAGTVDLEGSSAGSATAIASASVARTLRAASAGTSAALAILAVARPLGGVSVGASAADASLSRRAQIAGAAAGEGGAVASLARVRGFAGESAGTCDAAAALAVLRVVGGSCAGTSSATASLATKRRRVRLLGVHGCIVVPTAARDLAPSQVRDRAVACAAAPSRGVDVAALAVRAFAVVEPSPRRAVAITIGGATVDTFTIFQGDAGPFDLVITEDGRPVDLTDAVLTGFWVHESSPTVELPFAIAATNALLGRVRHVFTAAETAAARPGMYGARVTVDRGDGDVATYPGPKLPAVKVRIERRTAP